MSRDVRLYLTDMLTCCNKVLSYTAGSSQSEFVANEMAYDATIRNLEVIGEAAKHVPDEVRSQIEDVEWRQITGFRDILAHAYFGLDNDIIWDVIQRHVPRLRRALAEYLTQPSP